MTDWPVKTLGDVARIEMGRTPSRREPGGWDKDLKTSNLWATIADLTACDSRVLSKTKERISDAAAHVTKVVPAGTLMMSFKLSIGKLAFAGCDLYTNEAIAAFHLPDDSAINVEFLYWSLVVTDWAALTLGSEKVKGATMTKAKLYLVEIPVPPLEEQKRIVALLDAATASITELTACYEQARTHADNLFTSALRDALEGNPDWPVKTLGEVCSIDSLLVDPRESRYSDLFHVGAGNIESVSGRLLNVQTAAEEGLISGKFLFSSEDVLYSKIRPYLKKVATPEFSGLCSADVYPLRPGTTIRRMFLFHILNSENFTQYAIAGSSRTGMPKVNRDHLFKYEFEVPAVSIQDEIVARLDSIRAKTSEMVAAYDAKLTAAKNLRQSILESAFAGEL